MAVGRIGGFWIGNFTCRVGHAVYCQFCFMLVGPHYQFSPDYVGTFMGTLLSVLRPPTPLPHTPLRVLMVPETVGMVWRCASSGTEDLAFGGTAAAAGV